MVAEYVEPHWARSRPVEDGLYWYREDHHGELVASVIKWDSDSCVATGIGWDMSLSARNLPGEFWSDRLEVPL